VETCPEDVLTFGERGDLLAIAHERIAQSPQKYLPTVFGEFEAGGTALLYISDVSLDFLGFNGATGDEPYPALTWNWLEKFPVVSLGTAALATGLFSIIGRRVQAKLAQQQTNQTPEEK
jgi:formate dehydrogenase iron-sulfur subunit